MRDPVSKHKGRSKPGRHLPLTSGLHTCMHHTCGTGVACSPVKLPVQGTAQAPLVFHPHPKALEWVVTKIQESVLSNCPSTEQLVDDGAGTWARRNSHLWGSRFRRIHFPDEERAEKSRVAQFPRESLGRRSPTRAPEPEAQRGACLGVGSYE